MLCFIHPLESRPVRALLWDPARCAGPGSGPRRRPPPRCLTHWSLPRALLLSSSLRGFGASLSAVLSCPSSSLSPKSGMSRPETFGDPPSMCHADGHPEVRGGTARAALWAPQPRLLPPRHRPWSRGPPSCPGPCPGRPVAAPGRRPLPVTCSRARAPSRGGWPAEGPVGPEMCHHQGGERPLGEEPCRCILFSKKIKYFHGKLSLCVFLSPLSPSVPFSWVVFQGQLRVSLPWRPHPADLSWLRLWARPCLGPGLCGGWHAPVRHLCSLCLALAGRGRVRGWPSGRRSTVSHGSLSASCAFPLCRPSVGSAHQASDTPWALSALRVSLLPAHRREVGVLGPGSQPPLPQQHRDFASLGKLLSSAI